MIMKLYWVGANLNMPGIHAHLVIYRSRELTDQLSRHTSALFSFTTLTPCGPVPASHGFYQRA